MLPAALLLLALMLAGCSAPPASRGSFDSPDPSSRLYAIVRAGQNKDRTAIPRLIESLASDDQAVRMYSIGSLNRITGKTYDYLYYDAPAKREQAVQRWLAALNSGELGKDIQPAAAHKTAGGQNGS